MHGPKDPLGWAKRPRSALAVQRVQELARQDRRFPPIVERLVKSGVASAEGKLLQRWNGTEWEAVGGAA